MKGVIALATKELILDKFGEEKWAEILQHAGITDEPLIFVTSNVDDNLILSIIKSIGEVLNLSLEQIAEVWGDYWVNVYTQKSYSIYYERAKSAKEFLLALDDLHQAMTRNIKDANPPKFEYYHYDENTLIMTYISARGLIDFAIGAIKGVGKYYNEDIEVKKVDNNTIKVVFKQTY